MTVAAELAAARASLLAGYSAGARLMQRLDADEHPAADDERDVLDALWAALTDEQRAALEHAPAREPAVGWPDGVKAARGELAAAQATLARLREALADLYEHDRAPARAFLGRHAVERSEHHGLAHVPDRVMEAARAALALPHGRAALDVALAEARREGASEASRQCVAAARAVYDAKASTAKPPWPDRVLSASDMLCAVEAEAARIEAER